MSASKEFVNTQRTLYSREYKDDENLNSYRKNTDIDHT